MNTLYESSNTKGNAHISCIKYRNLNNISHYHSDFELVYVNEGCAKVTVDENIFNLKAKDCVFISGNDIHHIQSSEETVITVLKAENKFFENLFASKKLLSPVLKNNDDVESVLGQIKSELSSFLDNSGMMADSIATQFFIKMLRTEKTTCCDDTRSSKPNITERFSQICDKISNEYRTITFEETAEHMYFSKPYFSKLFHNLFGMTFSQYLNTVRVASAIEKIKQGNMSITEISTDCGFNTIRNFNRVFKNLTGYSPNNLPSDYVFLYSLQDGYGLDPTLNCTEIL